MILLGLHTFLSCLETREANRLYHVSEVIIAYRFTSGEKKIP